MHQQIILPSFTVRMLYLYSLSPQSCDDVTPTEQCYQPACTNVTRPSLRKECREVIVMIMMIMMMMVMMMMMMVRCMTKSAK